jgi:hypothetical protein
MGNGMSSRFAATVIVLLACATAMLGCVPARRAVVPIQESEPPAEVAERDALAAPAQPGSEGRTTDERRETAARPATPPRAQPDATKRGTPQPRPETARPDDRREAPPTARPPAPPPQPKPAAPPPPAESDETQSQTGAFVVEYDPEPEPIPFNKLFSLRVRVLENTPIRSPAKDVQVVADAAMPEHGHGMNTKPTTRLLRPGEFMIEGMLFHMPGQWEIYIDVTRDGVTERARFPVTLE